MILFVVVVVVVVVVDWVVGLLFCRTMWNEQQEMQWCSGAVVQYVTR